MRSSADLHVGDLDFREILAMSGVAAIPGTAREAEDPDLLVLAVAHDLGGNLGALHVRRPALDLLAVACDEHVIEGDFRSRLRVEERDFDRDSRLGAELTATGRENRVAHRARNLNRDLGLVKRPRTARLHRAQQDAPSFGIRQAASSDRRGPRAPSRSASRAGAGNSAPAPPSRGRLRDGDEPIVGAPYDRLPRVSATAPCAAPRLRAGTPGPSPYRSDTRSSWIARAMGARAAGSFRRVPALRPQRPESWRDRGRDACGAPAAPCPGSSASPCR